MMMAVTKIKRVVNASRVYISGHKIVGMAGGNNYKYNKEKIRM